MNIYSIYKITNRINNKSYIGYSSNVERRLAQHKNYIKNNKKVGKFINALRKYGTDYFSSIIIYQSKCKNDILEKEIYFINLYNSIEEGYNTAVGGEGGCWNRGYTDEQRTNHSEKMSKLLRGSGNPMWKKKLSKESLNKMKESRLKNNGEWISSKNSKYILKYKNKVYNSKKQLIKLEFEYLLTYLFYYIFEILLFLNFFLNELRL
jgi:group I intron endonuclease